jgi:hypothetical protein
MQFVANSKTEDNKSIYDLLVNDVYMESVIVSTAHQDPPFAMSFVDDPYLILRSPERWHELWEFYIFD